MPFGPALEKLTIASLENTKLEVAAQYNPKELQLDKAIAWGAHNQRDNRASHRRELAEGQHDLEFTGGEGRAMSVELLFDRYELDKSVEPTVDVLELLSSVTDPESADETLRRPHHCVVVWGVAGMKPFRCVIEALSVKYTMFSTDGVPLRAVCTVKLREASRIAVDKEPHEKAGRTVNRTQAPAQRPSLPYSR